MVLFTVSTYDIISSTVKFGKFAKFLLQLSHKFKFCKSAINSYGHDVDLILSLWGG